MTEPHGSIPAAAAPDGRAPGAWPRRESPAEVLVVFGAFQAALWLGAGRPPAPDEAASWMRVLGTGLAALAAAYALFVAPRLHGDDWHAIGLARPLELRTVWPGLATGHRVAAVLLMFALPAAIVWFGWDHMLVRLGIRRTWADLYGQLLAAPWRQLGQTVLALLLGGALAAVLVRWSNLRSATRALAWPTAAMLLAAVALAALVPAGGAEASGGWRLRPAGDRGFVARLSVYVPWAMAQQWLLLGYLNTRIRNLVPVARRNGRSERAAVALLTGAAFAGMHAPQPALMAFTLASGAIWGWLFQRDDCRNLFAVGLAHALIGTALAALAGMPLVVGR